MLQSFQRLLAGNWIAAVMICVFLLFFGTMLAARFNSRWGYVIMILAVGIGLYTLMLKGIFRL